MRRIVREAEVVAVKEVRHVHLVWVLFVRVCEDVSPLQDLVLVAKDVINQK